MFLGNEASLDTLDLLMVLREKDKRNLLLNMNFSDIILVFDFEPHDHQFNEDKIELMMEYFNESSDNGKLYINYPMVESYKHFKHIPDAEFIDRMVNIECLNNRLYKTVVGKETCLHDLRKINEETFSYIIKQNIRKSFYLCKQEKLDVEKIKDLYSSFDNIDILQVQIAALSNGYVYILNTCLFFLCDYNINLIL